MFNVYISKSKTAQDTKMYEEIREQLSNLFPDLLITAFEGGKYTTEHTVGKANICLLIPYNSKTGYLSKGVFTEADYCLHHSIPVYIVGRTSTNELSLIRIRSIRETSGNWLTDFGKVSSFYTPSLSVQKLFEKYSMVGALQQKPKLNLHLLLLRR